MKRKLSLVVASLTVLALIMTSCAGNKTKSKETSQKKEPVKIVWGGWENKLMALELIERFNKENPDIKVEFFSNGQWLGNEQMSKLVASNQMPDIINLENPVVPVQNDWVIDLKPYLDKDTGSKKLYNNFVKYGTVNNKVIMLPEKIYLWGLFVNKDLLSSYNIPVPGYDWTVDDYVNILKKTTKKGVSIGSNGVNEIMKHLPPQMNDSLGWGSFNEAKKEYELGDEWKYAANVAADLYKSNVSLYEHEDALGVPSNYPEGSKEQKDVNAKREKFMEDTVGEKTDYDAWLKGKAATWMDFSWSLGFDKNAGFGGFDWDYYPFPTKDKGDKSRPGLVVDSLAITTKCKNPDAAFRFLKYLTYDIKGFDDRYDIVKNYNKDKLKEKYKGVLDDTFFNEPLNFGNIPAINDQAIISKWLELNNTKPGVAYMIGNMGTGYVDGFKVTPGFDEAYHKTIEKTVVEQVYTGKKTPEDLAQELQDKANEITKKAFDALNK